MAALRGEQGNTITLAGRTYRSRLMVGTGKYKDFEQTAQALEESGAELITVALRRISLERGRGESLLDYIDPKRYALLPNTAGCYNVEDAVLTARLAREALGTKLVKLEVIGDPNTLFPDVRGLLKATEILIKDGFDVLPYTSDDPIVCKELEAMGCAAVMPLAAPIGSGLGIRNPYNLAIILETIRVPVIVDAGVGTASDVAVAMELGCDGVLLNTAIAGATDPIKMARAMRHAVEAGRLAYEAGRIPKKLYANASSPLEGVVRAGA
ncbi:MAG: thiazole synthase [Candidatus Eisenbacteria bacterium]